MQIESFCSLSYGAKGLLFWAVISRPGNFAWAPIQKIITGSSGHLSTATINYGKKKVNGQEVSLIKTTLYPYLSNLITELRRFEYLFIHSQVKRIGSRGLESDYRVPPMGSYPFGPLSAIRTSNGRFLITYHQTPYSEFVVFVNLSFTESYSLTVESQYQITELTGRGQAPGPAIPIDPFDGVREIQAEKSPKAVTSISTTIEPADWRIFLRRL